MRALIVLLPLVFACNKGGPDDSGPEDTDDTDVGVDPASCPPYSGMDNPDQTWTFESTPQFVNDGGWYSAYSTRITSSTVADDGQSTTIVTYSEGDTEAPYTDSATFESNVTTRCDIDGVWLLRVRFDYVYTVLGNDHVCLADTVYDEPDLIWKRDAEVGTTWHSDPSGTYDDGTGPVPFTFSADHEVTEAGSTTVPGGTFDTLTLATTLDDGENEPGTTYQKADAVLGVIWSDIAQMTGHSP